ncbi:L-asparaginase II [Scopulibacillus daqui]|uniref:L-asparaginase II n=1 Tax=Scopulibacillus daqui TaxID=1469162 RepID=A0ABS2Q2N7_9BACL|nr:asparaginase [Scopulibacillus daqui]MBM7646559.1 L-asparaginase II [Scopulibacillus daqui]
MGHPVLVNERRGNIIENIHEGIICGVTDNRELAFHIGDANTYVYYRSAAKPLQAIPLFKENIDKKYRLTDQEAALFTASQRGEDYHLKALESALEKLGLDENDLCCPPSYPLNEKPKEQYLNHNLSRRRLLHNCSGKHLGFLAWCKEKGMSKSGYWDINHPLQTLIHHTLSELSECPKESIKIAVDGCGVPVFALPLKHMALSYLKLACPDLIKDTETREAVRRMTAIMNHAPEMVASHQFICTELLKDDNIVAKGGAQGVYCLGLKKERTAVALKVYSGSEAVWPNIIARVLEQLDYENKKTINRLKQLKPNKIINDSGWVVGQIETPFKLNKAI